jgi:putative Mn2+ efflux pump MntP
VTPWTKLVSAVALGISANSENLLVGLALGLRGTRIGKLGNLMIAVLTTVATLLPQAVGRSFRDVMPIQAPDVIAGLLLVGLGFLNIWRDRHRQQAQAGPVTLPPGVGPRINIREALIIGSALSINNVGLGFAGGIAGLNYLAVGLSVAGFSLLLLWLGEWFSKALAPRTARILGYATLDGNILLIAIGVLMMGGV